MYHLATMHSITDTDRQTDRQTDDITTSISVNIRSYCMQYGRLLNHQLFLET